MAAKNRTADRIKHLRALIDHDRTPEHERAAAAAMLERIRANNPATTGDHDPYAGGPYARTYGEKYNHLPKYASTVEIAKVIRAEIKFARKTAKATTTTGDIKAFDPIGDAPDPITYGVRVPHHGSINVTVKNIPSEWGDVRETRNGHEADYPTEALRTLGHALRDVMSAYNHDGSDSQTDYFDVRFYGFVVDECGLVLG
ncbi:hypothetical protein ACFWPX_30045 [Nocardia sp. NPDC058518]|uniref:hypothetical protein n=1 Tax=Nocardia sp. NPDC058518 TaxID=3346534 RepID=UPI0036539522